MARMSVRGFLLSAVQDSPRSLAKDESRKILGGSFCGKNGKGENKMKTKTTTHTPGPWTYSVTNEGNIGSKDKVRVEGPDGHIAIACRIMKSERNTFGPVGVHRNLPEVKANARLIAAAPELLAALTALVLYQSEKSPAFIQAQAAIAKAEGR